MFNEKRIDDIRKKIQVSTILSDHEKSDWLNLLELMNDKQLGELEEILGAMPTTSFKPFVQSEQSVQPAQSQQSASVNSAIKMPPLSHIANIPADVTMTHSIPQTSQAELPRTTPSASLPNLNRKPPVPQPTKPDPLRVIPQTPKPQLKPQPDKSALPHATPQVPNPKSAPPPTQPVELKKLSVEHASDIQEFSAQTLREYELQSVVDAIKLNIEQSGYYAILQLLEQSQLYSSYIQTGKKMLGHQGEPNKEEASMLTQNEFEFITDLLRHMRFNAW